jgi:hypothetical protein
MTSANTISLAPVTDVDMVRRAREKRGGWRTASNRT